MTTSKQKILFILLTPVFFILSMWASTFPHEFAHSFTAWYYGFKENPLALYYGHFNWQNIIFVTGIDENVNYYLLYLLDHPKIIGATAFSGLFVTLLFYITTLLILQLHSIKQKHYLYYFLFWINLVNLSELVSYVILRSFSEHGDIAHIEYGWNISPWLIFIIGGLLLSAAVIHFFIYTLVELYNVMPLDKKSLRLFILICTSFIMFAQSGVRMFLASYGIFATTLGVIFFILFFLTILFCYPQVKPRVFVKD